MEIEFKLCDPAAAGVDFDYRIACADCGKIITRESGQFYEVGEEGEDKYILCPECCASLEKLMDMDEPEEGTVLN